MDGEELWGELVQRLRREGAELGDVCDCSAPVLAELLADLHFSALQRARLQTEWTRRLQHSAAVPVQLTSPDAAVAFDALPAGAGCSVSAVDRLEQTWLEERFAADTLKLPQPAAVRTLWWWPSMNPVAKARGAGAAVSDAARVGFAPFDPSGGLHFGPTPADVQCGGRSLLCDVAVPAGTPDGGVVVRREHQALPRCIVTLRRGGAPRPEAAPTRSSSAVEEGRASAPECRRNAAAEERASPAPPPPPPGSRGLGPAQDLPTPRQPTAQTPRTPRRFPSGPGPSGPATQLPTLQRPELPRTSRHPLRPPSEASRTVSSSPPSPPPSLPVFDAHQAPGDLPAPRRPSADGTAPQPTRSKGVLAVPRQSSEPPTSLQQPVQPSPSRPLPPGVQLLSPAPLSPRKPVLAASPSPPPVASPTELLPQGTREPSPMPTFEYRANAGQIQETKILLSEVGQVVRSMAAAAKVRASEQAALDVQQAVVQTALHGPAASMSMTGPAPLLPAADIFNWTVARTEHPFERSAVPDRTVTASAAAVQLLDRTVPYSRVDTGEMTPFESDGVTEDEPERTSVPPSPPSPPSPHRSVSPSAGARLLDVTAFSAEEELMRDPRVNAFDVGKLQMDRQLEHGDVVRRLSVGSLQRMPTGPAPSTASTQTPRWDRRFSLLQFPGDPQPALAPTTPPRKRTWRRRGGVRGSEESTGAASEPPAQDAWEVRVQEALDRIADLEADTTIQEQNGTVQDRLTATLGSSRSSRNEPEQVEAAEPRQKWRGVLGRLLPDWPAAWGTPDRGALADGLKESGCVMLPPRFAEAGGDEEEEVVARRSPPIPHAPCLDRGAAAVPLP